MFDLNKSVRRYARSVSSNWFFCGAQIVELEDHLHCEIEQFIAGGLTPEMAFEKATNQLGKSIQLQQEYRKNKQRLWRLVTLNVNLSTRTLNIMSAHPRLAVVGFFLVATLPLSVFLQRSLASKWTLLAFESCCAVAFKIIGIFS